MHEAERLNIERIAIIADELWPNGEVWPTELLRQWLHEQHARGIWIKFVRQSALAHEPDLIADIGIYGSRALGIQELDEQCRTVRFTLTFDFAQCRCGRRTLEAAGDLRRIFCELSGSVRNARIN